MSGVMRFFKSLPLELRYLSAWAAACLLAAAIGQILAPGTMPALLIGVSAGLATFYVFHRIMLSLERRRGAQLDREIGAQSTGPSRLELEEKEKELRDRWRQGTEKLKKAKISLYELPWFVIIGEPGGGKTMTLLNSGMDFPLGKDELPGFGGTRNYNWWFTNTAVILDTAGRLVFEQEGTSDRHEWEAFLKLLKRRRHCPINGLVIALPADKLLSDNAERRHHNASIVRDRLRQIQSVLDVRFPVFLLITKTDLVAGFTEFYNELSSLQRNQLFGWSRGGEFDTPYDPKEFKAEFQTLYGRLHDLRLQFMQPGGGTEAGWTYTFPEAFLALQDRIQDYIDVVFARNIFAEPLFFRGCYFTSALQEGRPILEVLGEQLSGEDLENLEGIFPQSRAFFIHDFYAEKMSKEQGMVFRSQRHIRRARLLKRLMLFAGLPVLIALPLLTALAYGSYGRTVSAPREHVQQALELVRHYKEMQEQNGVWAVRREDPDHAALALEIARQLDADIEHIQSPPGLASLLFGSLGPAAEQRIRTVQRELIGYCVVRPEVARVTAALTSAGTNLSQDSAEDYAASLATYIKWHFNEPRGTLQEFENLRRCLRTPLSEPLRDTVGRMVAAGPRGAGGRLSSALTADREHRRDVILKALAEAHGFWIRSAGLQETPEFAWWSELADRCDEAQARYVELCDMRREFENARQLKTLQQVIGDWLSMFPQPLQAAPGGPRNTRFLQRVRVHLHQAPMDPEDLHIVRPDVVVERARNRNQVFWETCEQAVLNSRTEGDPEFARRIRDAIESARKSFAQSLLNSWNRLESRVAELQGQFLEPYPNSQKPQRYDLVPAAKQAEEILAVLAGDLLRLSAEVHPSLEGWNNVLTELLEAPQPGFRFDFPRNPRFDDLRKLVDAVQQAGRRYQVQSVVQQVAELLRSAPDAGLAAYLEGHDEPAPALLYTNLRHRHGLAFMRNALRSKDRLLQALSTAVDRGWLLEVDELQRALDGALAQYQRHYLASWSESYGAHRLGGLSDYDQPANWAEYTRWLRTRSNDLHKNYQEHLDVLVRNVLTLLVAADGAAPDDLTRKLQIHPTEVDLPPDSRLAPLITALIADGRLPDHRAAGQRWRDYCAGIEALRTPGRAGSENQGALFPQLAAGSKALSAEWLTAQLQHVVDWGRWLSCSELTTTIKREFSQMEPRRRPFVFKQGVYEQVDAGRLRSSLAGLASLQVLLPQQAATAAAKDLSWLADAGRWHEFLDRESYGIELTYLAATSENANPASYYQSVALGLPGLMSWEGRAEPEVLFSSARTSAPLRCRWRPADGQVEVSVRDMTARTQQFPDAQVEPRFVRLPRSQFGLFQLIQVHGVGAGAGTGEWLVSLSKDLVGIDERPSSPKVIQFKIRFVEPAGGMPPQLEWPDFSTLVGLKPTPPWADAAQ